jgi:hypothetical protein
MDNDDYDSDELKEYKRQLRKKKSSESQSLSSDDDEQAGEDILDQLEEAAQHHKECIGASVLAQSSHNRIQHLLRKIEVADNPHDREMARLELSEEIAYFASLADQAKKEFDAYKGVVDGVSPNQILGG